VSSTVTPANPSAQSSNAKPPIAAPDVTDETIAAVRRFTRFYTRQIGLLQDGLLQTPFSITEARVLYELGRRDKPTASALAADLGLDHGYLSRILRHFAEKGLVSKTRAAHDGRQSLLSLTAKGNRAFASLDRGSQAQVAGLLAPLASA
jgi:DNA-binding MarR family transcriptional regulator